jgi:hypothetical protein
MLAQLPRHTTAIKVDDYEHLDLLWGKDVDRVVFPHVLEFLDKCTEGFERKGEGDVGSSTRDTYAQVASGHSKENNENRESDSDETMGEEPRD